MRHPLRGALILVLMVLTVSLSGIAGAQTVTFIDADGNPASTYLDGDTVHIRVEDSSAFSSVDVTVTSALAGDSETVSLGETEPGGIVFEGSIAMNPGGLAQTGTLETATSSGPPPTRDTLTVTYQAAQAQAGLLGAEVTFIDDAGLTRTAYAVGETFWVRVKDFLHNDPAFVDSFSVDLHDQATGIGTGEYLTMTETGSNTATFEGAASGDLGTTPGSTLEAIHDEGDGFASTTATAAVTASQTFFVDADGVPTNTILESDTARLRVVDSSANTNIFSIDSLSVDLDSQVAGDFESASLTETGEDTGVFEGSIDTSILPVSLGDGTLQTGETASAPYFDTLTATRFDAFGSSSATASTLGSRLWFIDADGNVTDAFALGERVYVRVEDQNRNTDPSQFDTTDVDLSAVDTLDQEILTLIETAKDSGIFEGWIQIQESTSNSNNDGLLQVYFTGPIDGSHADALGNTSSTAQADVVDVQVFFIDADGKRTSTLLEGSEARIRAYDYYSSQGLSQYISVTVDSLYGGDQESVTLNATAYGSMVFEGTIDLAFGFGTPFDDVLSTDNSGPPAYAADRVTVTGSSGNQATATTVGSELAFLDGFGRIATAVLYQDQVRVRVVDHLQNTPGSVDSFTVTLVNLSNGDSESVTVTETGLDTSLFEGSVPTNDSGPATPDGFLWVQVGETVELQHTNSGDGSLETLSVPVVGERVDFVDAHGQPVDAFLQGSRVFVRVFDPAFNYDPGSPQVGGVDLSTELGGDFETVMVEETGDDTGIFQGWIDTNIQPVSQHDGILQLTENVGVIHEFDRITVVYFGNYTQVTDTASTLGSRTWFIDAYGTVVDSVAIGQTVRVRVEDHNLNTDPSQFETAQADLYANLSGDTETVYLIETAKDSGIFEGSIDFVDDGTAFSNDGILQSSYDNYLDPPSQIQASHADALGNTQSQATAVVDEVSLTFIDADGEPTHELLEGDVARVRLFSTYANFDPYAVESLNVDLESLYGFDLESITLTETGYDTSVFEGQIDLTSNGGTPGDGTLSTSNGGPPQYTPDRVTARYYGAASPVETTATMIGSRLFFLDAFGREASGVTLGDAVRVRVVDPNRNDPGLVDGFSATLVGVESGDSETVNLTETGFDTGIFEGSIPSSQSNGFSSDDGILWIDFGQHVELQHTNSGDGSLNTLRVPVSGSTITFIDANGNPATVVLQGDVARIRVFDPNANYDSGSPNFAGIDLSTELSGDFETLSLTETGPDTSIFEGSIDTSIQSVYQGDGVLQVTENLGVIHEFDTLIATYFDAYGQSQTSVTTLGSRTWFIDEFGSTVTMVAAGSQVYVRVEDHNLNTDPSQFETAQADLYNLTRGDSEMVYLLETAKDSGIFEGSIQLTDVSGFSGDGQFEALAGDQIEASHQDALNNTSSRATATVDPQTLHFIDAGGVTTAELLEGDVARIRLVSDADNTDDFTAETVDVQVDTLYGSDIEFVTLTETEAASGVFEGQIDLTLNGGTPGDGTLNTANSGPPQYLADRVTATYNSASATATMVGSRLFFIDEYGQSVGFVVLGHDVRVRIQDPNRNDPGSIDGFSVTLLGVESGDSETVNVTETGFDTGFFEGSVPSSQSNGFSSDDGTLWIDAGQNVELQHTNSGDGSLNTLRAPVAGSTTYFLDADGNPTTVYLQGSTVTVRVFDPGANYDPNTVNANAVDINVGLTGDYESIPLNETGMDTSIFEGSMDTSIQSGFSGDGIIQVTENLGVIHEFDQIIATHFDAYGQSMAVADTLGSRTWFIDAFGNTVTMVAAGSQVYVRVEDHNLNTDPSQFETAQADLYNINNGDSETVYLIETAKDSSVFEGFIDLTEAPGFSGDGQLQGAAGDQLEASHQDALNNTSSRATATVDPQTVLFVDADGTPTAELLEGDVARIRLISAADNADDFIAESVSVHLDALYASDFEPVTLTETEAASGVFEGQIDLTLNGTAPSDGTLSTGNSGPPQYLADRVTATYNSASATATMVGSRLFFIDGFGQVVNFVTAGDTIRVRISDPNRDDPGLIDSFSVTLLGVESGDSETMNVTETGFSTGVFEGSIPSSRANGFSSDDGTLWIDYGQNVELQHTNSGDGSLNTLRRPVAGSQTLLVDANGQPTDVYLQGSTVYVRVFNPDANFDAASVNTTGVDISTELSGDSESLNLTETGQDTGIFEGSIDTSIQPVSQFDGVIQVTENLGVLHEFDQITVVHFDAYGQSVATATTLGSRTWFIDAFGNTVTMVAAGSQVYVRVEDHNLNTDPSQFETAQADLYNINNGDSETVYLIETAKDSSVFEGFIDLTEAPGFSGDGQLQGAAGDQLEASHQDALNNTSSRATATVDPQTVLFVDADGVATTELLEGDVARIRLISAADNADDFIAESVSVNLDSLYASDFEPVTLTETEAASGVFEGQIDLTLNGTAPSDGTLSTGNSGPPQYLADRVTATYNSASATATMIGSRLFFIDGFGQVVDFVTAGDTVRVRISDPNRGDPGLIDGFSVTLLGVESGDSETVNVTETGFSTGIFEGAIPSSRYNGSISDDGTLWIDYGQTVELQHTNSGDGSLNTLRRPVAGSQTLLVDANGQPTDVYLQGSTVFVRVFSPDANFDAGSVNTTGVDISTELSGDSESLNLTETGQDTGIFEGSIDTSIQPVSQFDGVIQVTENLGVLHEFDQITVVHFDAYGQSVATATTLGSRTWFIDAFGNTVTMVAAGSQVYVRVEDHNLNTDPSQFETAQADLYNINNGDSETVYLIETAKDSSVFEGFIDLTEAPGFSGDGQLQGAAGDQLEASHQDALNNTSSRATATVDPQTVLFVDADGVATTELLEGDVARIRLISAADNADPGFVEGAGVTVRALYSGDLEAIGLLETGPDTGVFEGEVDLRFGNTALEDGTLETSNSGPPQYLADQVTADYYGASAVATMIGSRLFLIDAFGQVLDFVAAGDTIRVRIVDQNRNDPGLIDGFSVTLLGVESGDSETVNVTETGQDTGIFEGSIPSSRSNGFTADDGTLWIDYGQNVELQHTNSGDGSLNTLRLPVRGSQTLFVDAMGQPVSVYLQGSTVTVRVFNPDANFDPASVDSTGVDLSTELSGDLETLNLTETGQDTGIFEGSIDTSIQPTSQFDGVIQVTENLGVLHEFDQITAVHFDAYGQSSATAGTLGSQTEFIDLLGNAATTYALGGQATVRVHSPNRNTDPGLAETAQADIFNDATGDSEQVYLTETGVDTGIFEGSITLQDNPSSVFSDGLLQVQAGSTIQASHADVLGNTQSNDTATVDANQAPQAQPDSAETLVDQPVTVAVLDNDSDPELAALTVIDAGPAANGMVVINGDHTVTYTPALDFDGVDTFRYVISDGAGGQAEALVTVTVNRNTAPMVAITLPENGASFFDGELVSFYGIVTDPEDGDISASLVWSSDLDGALGTGDSLHLSNLSVGTHTITASVVDSFGAPGSGSITVTINFNNPPTVDLAAPTDGATFLDGDSITFTGTAFDTEDGNLTPSLAWTSDLDGPLGAGGSFATNLSVGTHTITATVADSLGKEGTASLTVTVDPNTAPVVTITAPADGSSSTEGSRVLFTVTATDAESGDLVTSVNWTSDLDGALGTGSFLDLDNLTVGTHVITAEVSDPQGLQGSDSISVTVNANTEPELTITGPADGFTSIEGEIVSFTVTATDAEDGDLSFFVEWTSDLDGYLETAAGFSVNTLSVGTHTITASIDDANGGSASESITVIVNANTNPVVTLTAPTDASTSIEGESVTFAASANDAEDGDLTPSIAWTSSLDGAIGTGGGFSLTSLSVGTHTITATVDDTNGGSDSASVSITVNANTNPVVTLTAPTDASSSIEGESVNFAASANDAEDGDLTASIAWTSNLDGAIGSGGGFSLTTLSTGTHTITATVDDTNGGSDSASVSITVNANTNPVVTLTAPTDASSSIEGESVNFAASANDAEDGDLTASIAWTSNLDGAIGTGGGFSLTTLSVGTHTITATVDDTNGGSDSASVSITVNANTNPVVTLTAPTNGASSIAGESVTFAASANDAEDGDLTANINWTSSLDGTIGTGGGFSLTTLSVGTHTITATVNDANGGSDSASVSITVNANTNPVVTLTAPTNGSSTIAGESVTFAASANDAEDGDLTSSIAWTSSLDGAIGTGGGFSLTSLSVGTHTITATVDDANGGSDSASVSITVNANTNPVVTLTAPTNGATSIAGESVTFAASANDAEDGDLTASIAWTSSLDGAIGTGGGLSLTTLSTGTHTITATVNDANGGSDSASVSITVNANTNPVVTLTAPTNGASSIAGESVTFAASANDAEDGDLTASINWTSSLDGAIGTGGGFSLTSLSVGTHTITASVDDTNGGSDSASVSITVNANTNPVVTLTAPTNGSTSIAGELVTFAASANDAEDGDLTASIAWTSSLDGAIGSGGGFSLTTLSTGTHTITASVDDANGGSDSASVSITVNANTNPVVTLTAPTNGATSIAGESVTFAASANDAEDGDLTASIAWTSSLDGAIGSGGGFSLTTLSVGTHTITASVDDNNGGSDSASVSITVNANTNPVVTLTAPTNGATSIAGELVTFAASANDAEDGDLTASINWTSSLDGALGTGGGFSLTTLSVGTHTITASVDDNNGGSDSASVSITVNANTNPVVTLTAPTNGSSSIEGEPVNFAASANDAEDGDLTASIAWTSSLDGPIGTGGGFSLTTLSVGTHTITASVNDANGGSDSASVSITVNANTNPVVTLTAPTNGATSIAGESVTFAASANDAEDGDLTASIAWTSSLDGPIGTGGGFSLTTLSVGTHTITATVNDANGGSDSASVSITVNANTNPVVTLTAPTNGSTSIAGESVTFAASANDAEDGDLTASIAWTSSLDGAIGSGGGFSLTTLSTGTHTITATVDDANGGSDSASVSITVNANTNPVVTLTAPTNGSSSIAGESVTFAATANDAEDGDLTASIAWTSSLDGAIGSGGGFSLTTLSTGTHTITATVDDANGGSDSASVSITVNANTNPVVTLTAPTNGASSIAGESVTFAASANDAEDGDLTASINWTSSLDGAIGTGGGFSLTTLSVGTHTITASVDDANGGSDSTSVSITVNANTNPVVTLTAPTNGATSIAGESVTFAASANDAEDGDITASIAWTSSLDGAIGTGGGFSLTTLSVGTHTITASVDDANGGSDSASVSITVNANTNPVVTLTAPTNGSTSIAGEFVTFAASANDAEDGDLTASIAWTSSLDGALGTGGGFSLTTLSTGTHTITATVDDTNGGSDSASVSITVNANTNPVVTLTAPTNGSTSIAGEFVTFAASANDAEDGDLTSSIAWTSSLDGAIGSGGGFSSSLLSTGTHTITASVNDANGGSDSASVSITVNANTNPVVTLTAPTNGSTSIAGEFVTFAASANDAEDGDLTSSINWTSSLDGAIGSGGGFSSSLLSIGTHTITASVNDANGGSDSASVSITVNANTPPVVSITAPADGSKFAVGSTVTFTGSANDLENGDLTAAISWSSDLDGALGTGGSVATGGLSLGTHTITATVTDSHGASSSDTVTVEIKTPVTVTLISVAADDGYVIESNETSDVGGAFNSTNKGRRSLRFGDDGSDRQNKAFVSFDTSTLPDTAIVTSANLRLRRGRVQGTNPFDTHGSARVDVQSGGFGGNVALESSDFQATATAVAAATLSNALADGDWSEGLLDANGRAAVDLTGTTQMRLYFDLDDNDDGNSDQMGYYAANNNSASNRPQLVVTYIE